LKCVIFQLQVTSYISGRHSQMNKCGAFIVYRVTVDRKVSKFSTTKITWGPCTFGHWLGHP